MTPHSILNSLSSISKDNVKNTLQNRNKKIKKHHWFLGSIVIIAGSWITHTTTANIPNESPAAKALSISNAKLAPQPLTPQLKSQTPVSSDSDLLLKASIEKLPISAEEIVAEKFATLTHTIKSGDSLGTIFRKLNLNSSLPYKISKHKTAKKLVSISVGKQLVFELDDNKTLRRIIYPNNALQNFVVELKNNTVSGTQIVDLPYQTEQRIASGEISSSLYEAAIEVGMSNSIVMEMVRIFGWDVDFVLDIRAGDHFHVIYESHSLHGKSLKDGNILAAEFTTQGQTYRAIRFEDQLGQSSYYTPEGKSMLGTFLRSPVEFSRISSRFGKRKHPILKTWRAHNGVDYAASRGTPIRATADGKIISAGKKGGYGRTVVINHAGRFSTLYAHMNGYAKGIKSGARVKQGQVIGYVGSSGLATGPHLHYEFRVDGVHRNSLTYKTPKANSINKESKQDFLNVASIYQQKLNSIEQSYQLTKAASTSTATL